MMDQDSLRKDFFNQRAPAWLENHYKRPDTGTYDLHAERIRHIVGHLGLLPQSRVLDVGCGSGVLVPYLLEYLSADGRLIEMDFAEEMIRTNRKIHPDDRITFICSDVATMPVDPESLDAVICFACFPHFEHPEKALERIARGLVPGGRLIIAHLMSSQELSEHHNSHTPVCNDRLPDRERMAKMVDDAGFDMDSFEDRSGLYLLSAILRP